MDPNSSLMTAVIAQAGLPALHIALAVVLLAFLFGGISIFRRWPQFDRPRQVAGRRPIVRQNREELIIIVGSALMLLLVGILHQVWSA
jgi:hypothetical protein